MSGPKRAILVREVQGLPARKVVYELEQWAEGPYNASRIALLPCGRGQNFQILTDDLEYWPEDELDD